MKSQELKLWLVVEDDENDFILLQRALSRVDSKAKLRWVKDGTEAQDYLLNQNQFSDRARFPLPSLILSDLKMPRCSGLELVQWVRQQPDLRTLPFIIFSASDQPTDVGLAYQDGANWYLAKPSTFEDLVEMLRRLVENLSFSPLKADQ